MVDFTLVVRREDSRTSEIVDRTAIDCAGDRTIGVDLLLHCQGVVSRDIAKGADSVAVIPRRHDAVSVRRTFLADVQGSTGFVLLNIDIDEGTPATKIAPALGMEARSLTRMLKSLEEKGWIYREPDPKDGRSIRIFLTDLGKEKRELSRRAVREFNLQVTED